ncbi:MAG: oxygenase MpaB family protein [Micromonosporaceae bacterium]
MDAETDTGLFGPGSATWRVHAEPILWLAGLRALYLQSLHPRAVAGVVQNSNYQQDAWGRLIRTANYVGAVVYGSTAAAHRAAARVRGVHRKMRGRDPDTGEEFRLDEPELLLWIHITEVESFASTARRAGLDLTDAEVDDYFAEQTRAAKLIGLDPATVPDSAAAVRAYYSRMRPRLRLSRAAVDTAHFLAAPPLPWGLGWTPVRGAWLGVSGLGFSLLPRWARRLYGMPGLPTTDLSATVALRTLRAAIGTLPSSLSQGPIYADAMRRAALARQPDPDSPAPPLAS